MTAIALVVFVTMVATQTYALVVVGQTRSNNTTGGQTHSVRVNGTIRVSGIGHVDVQPDRAIITVGVVT